MSYLKMLLVFCLLCAPQYHAITAEEPLPTTAIDNLCKGISKRDWEIENDRLLRFGYKPHVSTPSDSWMSGAGYMKEAVTAHELGHAEAFFSIVFSFMSQLLEGRYFDESLSAEEFAQKYGTDFAAALTTIQQFLLRLIHQRLMLLIVHGNILAQMLMAL